MTQTRLPTIIKRTYGLLNEERALKENQRVVRDEITENSKEKGFGTKFYEAYKKMGEWNLAKVLPEKVMEKLESKEEKRTVLKLSPGKAILGTGKLFVLSAMYPEGGV